MRIEEISDKSPKGGTYPYAYLVAKLQKMGS